MKNRSTPLSSKRHFVTLTVSACLASISHAQTPPAQAQQVSDKDTTRTVFRALFAVDPELAKKLTITAVMCGFPLTSDTARKLTNNVEFNRLGSNAIELAEKCNVLLTPGRGPASSNQRPALPIAPETMLMQALSGQGFGGIPTNATGSSQSRTTSTRIAPEAFATPPGANGVKRELEGLNGWSGYVVGIPSSDTLFAPVKIGMSNREVMDLIGAPTDQGMHVTGKAWIPYFGGAGKTESWMHYKGVGRLLLSQDGGANLGRFYLIGIEHDANESGYR